MGIMNLKWWFEKNTKKESRNIRKCYVMKCRFFKQVKEKHSISKKSVCICRQRWMKKELRVKRKERKRERKGEAWRKGKYLKGIFLSVFFRQHIYIYKQDLALNDLQGLICLRIQIKQQSSREEFSTTVKSKDNKQELRSWDQRTA